LALWAMADALSSRCAHLKCTSRSPIWRNHKHCRLRTAFASADWLVRVVVACR
jgi:hypothetical protein